MELFTHTATRYTHTFVCHYASREVSFGMLTEVCKAHKYYLKLSCIFHRYVPFRLSLTIFYERGVQSKEWPTESKGHFNYKLKLL